MRAGGHGKQLLFVSNIKPLFFYWIDRVGHYTHYREPTDQVASDGIHSPKTKLRKCFYKSGRAELYQKVCLTLWQLGDGKRVHGIWELILSIMRRGMFCIVNELL